MSKPQSRSEWEARAEALQIRNQAFIDGRYVDDLSVAQVSDFVAANL